MDRASDFGSDGWEFESLRARSITAGQRHNTAKLTALQKAPWEQPGRNRSEKQTEPRPSGPNALGLGDRNDRRVDQAEAEIGVLTNQVTART